MKKILIILFISSPILLMGQSKGSFMFKMNYGMVSDSYHPNSHLSDATVEYSDGESIYGSVNNHSDDMQSNYNDRDDVENALQLSAGYFVCDNLLVGLNFMNSDIGGSNDVQYWNGSFKDRSLFAEYEFCNKYGVGFLAKAGIGRIKFTSDVNRLLDDAIVPNSGFEDENASKLMYGAGLSYKVYKFIKLNIEVTRNIVNHDGFDGWDNGTNKDRYLYTSAGLSFNIGTKNEISPKDKGAIRDIHLLLPLLLIAM